MQACAPETNKTHVQGAVLRWAATVVKDGKDSSCVEAAIRLATSGALDKSADAREAGSALMLTLLQVIPADLMLTHIAVMLQWQSFQPTSLKRSSYRHQWHGGLCGMQVHGRADVTQAVNSLSGATKKAASEALQKVSNSKEGMAVPEVSAVNSYAIAVSCESSPTEHGSRPPSRSGPSSTSVSPAA